MQIQQVGRASRQPRSDLVVAQGPDEFRRAGSSLDREAELAPWHGQIDWPPLAGVRSHVKPRRSRNSAS
jgi:hypothetical protein